MARACGPSEVPCAGCRAPIPAARAACAIANEMCVECNKSNLSSAHKREMPEYETVVWARGGRL